MKYLVNWVSLSMLERILTHGFKNGIEIGVYNVAQLKYIRLIYTYIVSFCCLKLP